MFGVCVIFNACRRPMLLSPDQDMLTNVAASLCAADLGRCRRASKVLKQLIDHEWEDEQGDPHSLWETHCESADLERDPQRHTSWQQVRSTIGLASSVAGLSPLCVALGLARVAVP